MIEIEGSTPLSTTHTDQLQVSSNLEALAEVLHWFEQQYEPQIPRSVWLRCQLALAEGFTNAVRHAHQDLFPKPPIDIEVTILPQQIEMRIWDQGPPFDLEKRIQQLLAQVDDQNAGGGRGLKLMRDIADNLTYRRTSDDRNCLFIMKRFEPTL